MGSKVSADPATTRLCYFKVIKYTFFRGFSEPLSNGSADLAMRTLPMRCGSVLDLAWNWVIRAQGPDEPSAPSFWLSGKNMNAVCGFSEPKVPGRWRVCVST